MPFWQSLISWMQRLPSEKRSSGFARAGTMDAPTHVDDELTPRGRKRSESTSTKRDPWKAMKAMLAAVYVYATVCATVWELWRRSVETQHGGTPPPEAVDVIPAPVVERKAEPVPEVTAGPSELQGSMLHASWKWAAPGGANMVGDQRLRATISALAPGDLKVNGASMGWTEIFQFVFDDGTKIAAHDCHLRSQNTLKEPPGVKQVKLVAGEALVFHCGTHIEVHWSIALLQVASGAEVLRTRFYFHGLSETNRVSLNRLAYITLLTLRVETCVKESAMDTWWQLDSSSGDALAGPAMDCFRVGGTVDGSPAVNPQRGLWAAVEHPRASSTFTNSSMELWLSSPRARTPYFTSLGAFRGGDQGRREALFLLRRHFNTYLDTVKVASNNRNLHYATWYDMRRTPCIDSSPLGYPACSAARSLNEKNVLERLQTIHRELGLRGTKLDGFMLSDGWDDAKSMWQVDPKNFPQGFQRVTQAVEERSVSLGVWLSPWGGFGEGGKRRLVFGRSLGLEAYNKSPSTLRLSGPKYYTWFRNMTRELAFKTRARMFKFDGIGTGLGASGAGRFARDIDQLMQLVEELRADTESLGSRPLQALVTTGSWPSPFWLLTADAVGRDGPDLGRKGAGSPRQQWITFRDAMMFETVVKQGPFFPLAGVSTGGIVWSRAEEPGAYLNSYELEDFTSEVRSYFLMGTSMEELQIQPDLLTSAHWDVLSEAANISQQYVQVLRDSHWIGGDPSKGEAYGYASYACPPCSGLVSWRNPQAAKQNVSFTLRRALALPKAWLHGSASVLWGLRPLWPGKEKLRLPMARDTVGLDEQLEVEMQALQFQTWHVRKDPAKV